jgi:hypothetical protein
VCVCVYRTSSRERSEQSLVRWAAPQLHDIDLLARMVDPALDGLYPSKSLSRFADIIAICVQVRTRVLCRYSCTKSISISSVGKKACFFVFFFFFLQPEPEFRPPMSEVVQQLVRLMQRAAIIRRQSDDLGYSYRVPDRDGGAAAGDVL